MHHETITVVCHCGKERELLSPRVIVAGGGDFADSRLLPGPCTGCGATLDLELPPENSVKGWRPPAQRLTTAAEADFAKFGIGQVRRQ